MHKGKGSLWYLLEAVHSEYGMLVTNDEVCLSLILRYQMRWSCRISFSKEAHNRRPYLNFFLEWGRWQSGKLVQVWPNLGKCIIIVPDLDEKLYQILPKVVWDFVQHVAQSQIQFCPTCCTNLYQILYVAVYILQSTLLRLAKFVQNPTSVKCLPNHSSDLKCQLWPYKCSMWMICNCGMHIMHLQNLPGPGIIPMWWNPRIMTNRILRSKSTLPVEKHGHDFIARGPWSWEIFS